MFFSLDVIRARKGDCLIVHFGSKDDPHLIMIDGGPSNVYKPHLKPRLEQLRNLRGLDEEDPLRVDALMLSHIDDDHIKGILDLTKELRESKEAHRPLFLRVGSLWHNSFDDLLKTTPEQLKAEAGFGVAALAGEIDLEGEGFDAAKVLASIPQGRELRDAARLLGWKINDKFKGDLVLATANTKPISLQGGLKLTVVGPLKTELLALQDAHDKWLREQRNKNKRSEAALAAFIDKSIPNLSSMVMLAEADGHTMLLTGDARGDKIIEGLQLVGCLDTGDDSTLYVDVLKVPHHGSANNLETSFFRRIKADHYVFSGNGEHGNPERESLEMLIAARNGGSFTMHFTYPIKEIDAERKKNWEKEQAKEKARAKSKIREHWSPKKHSLEDLLKDQKRLTKSIRVVEEGRPYIIDLLDHVGSK